MAEASSSSSSSFGCAYQVFLSFRGKDTRNNFTDHLYAGLKHAGIHTFRDDDELEIGEDIKQEIKKAIRESRVAVVVFSPDYASSRWCLDELVTINDCRKFGVMHIMPVFYHVDPSQVRNLTGIYGEAIARHEIRFKQEIDRVKAWKAALNQVADLSGMVLKNEHEAQFIQKLIMHVASKLDRKVLHVEPHLVGIDCYIDKIKTWLQDISTDARILTVYGIGGVGKTTIAKTVYNQNYDEFEGRCFLANVRETSQQPNGLLRLQKQLLSEILSRKSDKIYSVDEGIIKIKNALCCKRVLIVFDDVDDFSQFNAIIRMKEWLSPGSKIIVTTRVRSLFDDQQGCWMVHVHPLAQNNSFRLFCYHAFQQDRPKEDYVEHSLCVVRHANGLPLALSVMGSYLSRFRTIEEWESAIQELQEIPHGDILKILRISFDSLQNGHHKDLFLHIACFFIGMDKDVVVQILDGCGLYAMIGIQHLIDRSLIQINEHNKLAMHQLIRDMAKEIVRQESPDEPRKRSRIWSHTEAFDILTEKNGTETIRGLTLDAHVYEKTVHQPMLGDEENCSKRFGFSFFSQFANYISMASSPSSDHVIKTEAFTEMRKLKLLQLNNVKIEGTYEIFPKHLVWLCWHGFPLKSIPANFDLKKLVVLDMRNSSLQDAWKGIKCFPCLKILDLSHSHFLIKTPDFKGLPNLERLKLKGCVKLEEIDESIGVIEKLLLLNVKGCKKLKKVPRLSGSLKSLKKLVLVGCSELQGLPEELPEMKSLTVLLAGGITLNKSSFTFKKPIFSWLTGRSYPELTKFSFSLLPHSLVRLNLSDCNLTVEDFPKDLSFLTRLHHLNLSGNPITTLPEGIHMINGLGDIVLDGCNSLAYLPDKFYADQLSLKDCKALKTIYLRASDSIKFINLDGCENLSEFCGFFSLKSIFQWGLYDIVQQYGSQCKFEYLYLGSLGLEMINCLARRKIRTTFQALYERFGIYSLFFPGNEFPSWYNHQEAGSSLTFHFKCCPSYTIVRFQLFIIYEYEFETAELYDYSPIIRIHNKTKVKTWIYSPSLYAVGVVDADRPCLSNPPKTEACKDVLWVISWQFMDYFEDGDEVNFQVFMPFGLRVKRIGIHFVYDLLERVRSRFRPAHSAPEHYGYPDVVFFPRLQLMETFSTHPHVFLGNHHHSVRWAVKEFCGNTDAPYTLDEYASTMRRVQ